MGIQGWPFTIDNENSNENEYEHEHEHPHEHEHKQRSTVNGQPCMPHWAACVRHRGKIVKLFPIHRRLHKFYKSGSSERHRSSSTAAISHEGISFRRQKFSIILPQRYFGWPLRLCPSGCQAITLLIQRCTGNVAKYCARFQWCREQMNISMGMNIKMSMRRQSVRPVRLAALNLIQTFHSIGSKKFKHLFQCCSQNS